MADQDDPPFVDTRHCAVGVGLPVAAAVKIAVEPRVTVLFDGSRETTGAVSTSGGVVVPVDADGAAEVDVVVGDDEGAGSLNSLLAAATLKAAVARREPDRPRAV